MSKWTIQPLGSGHVRNQFRSGKESLDEFLISRAGQYSRKGIARTYVAVFDESPRVLGYYSLAAGSIQLGGLPAKLAKKLPRHPVPVALLARLAVDSSMQGQGLCAALLRDALLKSASLGESIGIFGVVVDALDEEAARFYSKYGFVALTDDPRRLVISLESIQKGRDTSGP